MWQDIVRKHFNTHESRHVCTKCHFLCNQESMPKHAICASQCKCCSICGLPLYHYKLHNGHICEKLAKQQATSIQFSPRSLKDRNTSVPKCMQQLPWHASVRESLFPHLQHHHSNTKANVTPIQTTSCSMDSITIPTAMPTNHLLSPRAVEFVQKKEHLSETCCNCKKGYIVHHKNRRWPLWFF